MWKELDARKVDAAGWSVLRSHCTLVLLILDATVQTAVAKAVVSAIATGNGR